ncbi:hypothetical protein [Enterococcus alishanensis]
MEISNEEVIRKKRIFRKHLFNRSYFLLIGIMILGYSIDNLIEMNKTSYFGYQYYSVPKILEWFFDKFGPIPTTIVMILISIGFISYFILGLLTYRKNMRELKNAQQIH